MKKSELYHLAQIAVVLSPAITAENKLEILKIMIEDENLAKYCEEQETPETAVEE